MPPDHRRAAFFVNARDESVGDRVGNRVDRVAKGVYRSKGLSVARDDPILYLSVDARAQDDPILYLSVDARAQEIAELGAELSAGGISISHPII
jgi:hypothetical protein